MRATASCARSMRDERGLPVGPFRVWLPERGFPGLAMSRAVGDSLASL
jgi:hypothetical protein